MLEKCISNKLCYDYTFPCAVCALPRKAFGVCCAVAQKCSSGNRFYCLLNYLVNARERHVYILSVAHSPTVSFPASSL